MRAGQTVLRASCPATLGLGSMTVAAHQLVVVQVAQGCNRCSMAAAEAGVRHEQAVQIDLVSQAP